MDYRDGVFEGETIVMDRAGAVGPNVILRDCTVISKQSAAALFFNEVRMIGGVYEQKKVLKNHNFDTVHFMNVRICGQFVGCDWGFQESFDVRKQYDQDSAEYNSDPHCSISDCDFSGAKVDYCRLFNCDLGTMKLPKWPYFTVVSPAQNLAAMQRRWPNQSLEISFDPRTESKVSRDTVARFYDSRTHAKLGGIDVEDLRALVELIPEVVIID